MAYILTNNEVRMTLNQDGDFPDEECERLSKIASSFIKNKTGYDFSKDEEIEEEAKACAELLVRQIYYGEDKYDKEHDYLVGIGSFIEDLKDIARGKVND